MAIANLETYRIPVIAEDRLRQLIDRDSANLSGSSVINGPPKYACLRPKKATNSGDAQKWELLVWPSPESGITYKLHLRYVTALDRIDLARPFPQSGPLHSETILQACLSVAEHRIKGARGQHFERFTELLQKSIQIDKSNWRSSSVSSYPTDDTVSRIPGSHSEELFRELGGYMNFGWNKMSWSHTETGIINDVIQSGIQQFLNPPIVASLKSHQHKWSFLFDEKKLTTVSGTSSYALPSDVSAIEGDLAFDSFQLIAPISLVSPRQIRELRQTSSINSGRPRYAAIRGDSDGVSSTYKFSIEFWPEPSAAYDLIYTARLRVDSEVKAAFVAGGGVHAETILASCLCTAEQRLEKTKGRQYDHFMQRLAASISFDMRALSPEFYGYNSDFSDGSLASISDPSKRVINVTVGGIQY